MSLISWKKLTLNLYKRKSILLLSQVQVGQVVLFLGILTTINIECFLPYVERSRHFTSSKWASGPSWSKMTSLYLSMYFSGYKLIKSITFSFLRLHMISHIRINSKIKFSEHWIWSQITIYVRQYLAKKNWICFKFFNNATFINH